MATSVIRNFLVPDMSLAYFPLMFQHSPCNEDDEEEEEKLGSNLGEREDEEEREEEEEDEESEAQEEEEECVEVFLNPAHQALDVTQQLLTFADLISRDVQRYFGRRSGDQEACDIYSDSVSVTTGGRLRYYDDLLRIARAGSPEDRDHNFVACDREGDEVGKGHSSLGPLAELFNHIGSGQGRGQPMVKRHLPPSFWTEPIPCCPLVTFSNTPDVAHANSDTSPHGSTDAANTHMPFSALTHHNAHTLENNQPDFSDLLANWDPNPLLENTHMQQ